MAVVGLPKEGVMVSSNPMSVVLVATAVPPKPPELPPNPPNPPKDDDEEPSVDPNPTLEEAA